MAALISVVTQYYTNAMMIKPFQLLANQMAHGIPEHHHVIRVVIFLLTLPMDIIKKLFSPTSHLRLHMNVMKDTDWLERQTSTVSLHNGYPKLHSVKLYARNQR